MEVGEEAAIQRQKRSTFKSFNPCCNGSGWRRFSLHCLCLDVGKVSILVVMEVGEEGENQVNYNLQILSFNPCCNGSGWRRIIMSFKESNLVRFNPCCNGSGWRRYYCNSMACDLYRFNPCCNGSGWRSRYAAKIQQIEALQPVLFFLKSH